MSYTEFYCQLTGSNLNAGSTTADDASVTSTNGSWGVVANQFLAASGTPFAGVTVGEWASIYLDGTTTSTGYVARVVGIVGGGTGLDLSSTAIGGAAPAALATGRTCKIGGAWRGPGVVASTISFPFITGFSLSMTNAAGEPPRVNFKAGTYPFAGAITILTAGITYEGYTHTPGDGGVASFSAEGVAGNFALITTTTATTGVVFRGLDFGYSGTSGFNPVFNCNNSTELLFDRCVFHHARGHGFTSGNATSFVMVDCEAHTNNEASGSGYAGIVVGARAILRRCIAHGNRGGPSVGSTDGFSTIGAFSVVFDRCITYNNSQLGFQLANTVSVHLTGCEIYNNDFAGVGVTAAQYCLVTMENCNFIKNGGVGIYSNGSTSRNGYIRNCGFGSGTMANAGVDISSSMSRLDQSGNINYPADQTPWEDPDAGNFKIVLAQAKGAGIGTFTQTMPGFESFTSYPDIGAAQHQETPTPTSAPPSYSTP